MSSTAVAASPVNATNRVWFGIDVSSKKFDAAFRAQSHAPVQSEEIRRMPTECFERTAEGVAKFLEWMDKRVAADQQPAIVMEATGSLALELAAWIDQKRAWTHVAIVAPKRIKSHAEAIGVRNKTDDLDARVIACYGAERRPASLEPHDKCHRSLKTILRARLALVEERTANQLRLEEAQREHLDPACAKIITRSLAKVIKTLDSEIERLEQNTDQLVAGQSQQLKADIACARKIQGVGPIVSTTVIGELGDLRRFKSKQLAAFTGVNPVIRKSGTSVKGRSRMSKAGSPHVRRVLYLAAMSAIQLDNDFARLYQKLTARGKSRNKALGAVMRSILLTIRSVVIHNSDYNPQYLVEKLRTKSQKKKKHP